MSRQKLILCMKWGTVFPPEYVNILYRACRDNLTGEFRFVCLTDDGEGLLADVEVRSIPDIGLTAEQWYTRGVWPKLCLFQKELHDLQGRALFIDLDMMVVGSLDSFFEPHSPLTVLDVGDGWRPNKSAPPEVGTGVFAFTIGEQGQILESFQSDISKVIENYHNEQAYVADKGDGITFWPKGRVISFKRFLRHGLSKDLFTTPRKPSEDVSIVAFHGTPRPIDLVKRGIWGQFPHLGRSPVSWVKEYWTHYISD